MRIIVVMLFMMIVLNVSGQNNTIKWVQRSSLPSCSSAFRIGSFLIDSDLYIVGGWVGVQALLSNNVWRYHIPSDSWHQMMNLPFGASACAATYVFNGKGYFLTAADSVYNYNCDKMLWQYDPTGDTWQRLADFPDSGRQNSSFFQYNDKGYVGQTGGCTVTDTHFWEYDPILNIWSQVATLYSDNIGANGVSAPLSNNSHEYLFGGANNNGDAIGDIWCYNIILNNWDSIGQMPGYPRGYGIFWGLDSIIIGGGGETKSGGQSPYFVKDFYTYTPFMNIWKSLTFQNFPDSAAFGVTFVYGKTIYYFGGPSDGEGDGYNIGIWSADVLKYFPDTTVGIGVIKPETAFTLYPNPVNKGNGFSISTSESGDVIFYNELGQVIYEQKINAGTNPIRLTTENKVLSYHATLQSGLTENGKIVIY